MALLTKEEIERTRSPKMARVGLDEAPPFDFWSYADEIPFEHFAGYDCSEGRVEWSYRTDDGVYEHVHISTKEDKDAFLVLILDLRKRQVYGHYLLDLKKEYGLR